MYFVTHIFLKNEVHTNIGGGRDNIIRDNVFYNATLNAMQVDHRGTAHSVDTTLYDKLRVRYFISVETSCVILMLIEKLSFNWRTCLMYREYLLRLGYGPRNIQSWLSLNRTVQANQEVSLFFLEMIKMKL